MLEPRFVLPALGPIPPNASIVTSDGLIRSTAARNTFGARRRPSCADSCAHPDAEYTIATKNRTTEDTEERRGWMRDSNVMIATVDFDLQLRCNIRLSPYRLSSSATLCDLCGE